MSRLDQEVVSVTSFLCLAQGLNIACNVRMTRDTTALNASKIASVDWASPRHLYLLTGNQSPEWTLPNRLGCSPRPLEADLQEHRLWFRSSGGLWKSVLSPRHEDQEKNGMQTGVFIHTVCLTSWLWVIYHDPRFCPYAGFYLRFLPLDGSRGACLR